MHHVSLAPPHPIQHPPSPPHPPHRRTRTEIVITRAGILGLRSRLARSGPGGPAQPLDRKSTRLNSSHLIASRMPSSSPASPVSRFPGSIDTHHVSLGPPHPVQHPPSPPRRTRTEIVITRAGILGLMWRLARSGPGGPAQPLQVSRLHPHASCLTCATSPRPTPAPPALSNPV